MSLSTNIPAVFGTQASACFLQTHAQHKPVYGARAALADYHMSIELCVMSGDD